MTNIILIILTFFTVVLLAKWSRVLCWGINWLRFCGVLCGLILGIPKLVRQ